jgi:hypothetical protein
MTSLTQMNCKKNHCISGSFHSSKNQLLVIHGVVQSVQRLDYGLYDRSSIPGRGNDGIFLFATPSKLALGSLHPASYPMCIGGIIPEIKAAGV